MNLEKTEIIEKIYKVLSSYPWIAFGFQKDDLLSISFHGRPRQNLYIYMILGEVYPSKIKEFFLSNNISNKHILICEYLPKSSQEFLQHHRINYIDSYGNIFINTEIFFFHRESILKPRKSESPLKSLFSPKTSQILITMLSNHKKHYQVQELSHEADVSIGLVSKTKSLLLKHKLAKESDIGEFFLTSSQELLLIWKKHYKVPKITRKSYYCSYFGTELEIKLAEFFKTINFNPYVKTALGSTSAAYRIAPYLRSKTIEMYANTLGIKKAIDFFELQEVSSGGNFVFMQTDQNNVFFKPYQTDNGIICTNLIQIILDLSTLNDRAIEASEYLEGKLYAS